MAGNEILASGLIRNLTPNSLYYTVFATNISSTNTWVGNNGDWNVDGNWSLGHIPRIDEDVLIDNVADVVNLTTTGAVSQSIKINNGKFAVTNTGFLTVDQLMLDKAGMENVNGEITISGKVHILNATCEE